MVTKPTGRPGGRPRKAAAPKLPSGTTGRPAKPIETDPNRYLYVEIQSLISYHGAATTGATANKVAETVIAGHYGTPVTTETIIGYDGKPLPPEDNIKPMVEGRPFRVYAPERVGLLEKKKERHYDAKWRNKNIFRAAVDGALHKLRALRDERNPWLMTMDALVNICLSGVSEDPVVIECCRQMAELDWGAP